MGRTLSSVATKGLWRPTRSSTSWRAVGRDRPGLGEERREAGAWNGGRLPDTRTSERRRKGEEQTAQEPLDETSPQRVGATFTASANMLRPSSEPHVAASMSASQPSQEPRTASKRSMAKTGNNHCETSL